MIKPSDSTAHECKLGCQQQSGWSTALDQLCELLSFSFYSCYLNASGLAVSTGGMGTATVVAVASQNVFLKS